MTHVADYKKKDVKKFEKLIKDYPVVASVNMENIPAPQLLKMRTQLRGRAELVMCKRRLLNIAIENSKDAKKDIGELKKHLGGMPALIFTKDNPFILAKLLRKSKSSAPAKPGQIAPRDLIIEAGPTGFLPGPIISEFSQLGIKTGVEAGKIAIKETKVLVKKGDKINEKQAAMLTRLNIQPMEIGLLMEAAYENGIIFSREVLNVDEQEYINNLSLIAQECINLAVEAGYMTKETAEIMLMKANIEANALENEIKLKISQ